ncbi:MAG TPA: serine hydrolase [Acidobacteriota bacterium]|nr:serine hydrolase [Acidobacteriota bacterium]
MRNRIFPFLSAILMLSSAVFVTAQEKTAVDPFDDFPEFVEKVMADWDVPGLAVAVIKDGEVIYKQGFGFRDVKNQKPVTTETLFAIGSCSKAFTVMAMGMLVDEGKLDLDKPVIDYLNDFRLKDEFATLHMKPRDLVCHDSGLPRHDLSWYGSSAGRDELYQRLRYLEPNVDFRSLWQYNNFMFLTAGVLVERITGQKWEQVVSERIFKPLGMSGSNFSVNDSQKTEDFSLPYGEEDKETVEIPFRNIDAIGPAGSINSNVEEMSRWILLHLNKGKAGEEQLINEATIAQMHTPHMALRQAARYAETPIASYGLGWFIQPYRGHHMIQHGGGIDGFISLVSFMPFDNIGVVVLTNKSPSPLAPYITYNVYDRLLGLDPVDWNSRGLEDRKKAEEAEEKSKAEADSKRKLGTSPSLPLEQYAGTYEFPGYDRLVVALEEEQLKLTYNGMTSPLAHYHYDIFTAASEEFGDLRVWFQLNADGEIGSVAVPLQDGVKDIVFERVPDESLADVEILKKYVGEYDLMGQTIAISLRADGVLTADVPGQPTYELSPYRENEFKLKGLDGYSVEFKLDDAGNVTAAAIHQPNGTFTADRK